MPKDKKEKEEPEFYSFKGKEMRKIRVGQFHVVPDITVTINNKLLLELSVENARKLYNGLGKAQYYGHNEYWDKRVKKVDDKDRVKKDKR